MLHQRRAKRFVDSVGLARHCDTLGYTRYWAAEHHNMANIATSAPGVLIAHIAATTTRMRSHQKLTNQINTGVNIARV